MADEFSRRALLAGLTATACSRKRATRYHGWLFVASGAGKSVAVADLAFFRRVATIPLAHAPDQLFHSGGRVFATCREGQVLVEIDPQTLRVAGKIGLPGKPVAARLELDGKSAIIVTDEPSALLTIDLATQRVTARLPLPGAASDLDVTQTQAAIAIPGRNSIARVAFPELKLIGITDVGVPCEALRFRPTARQSWRVRRRPARSFRSMSQRANCWRGFPCRSLPHVSASTATAGRCS